MAEQDDQHWFEILAGRKPAQVDPLTEKEAQALRRAILAHGKDEAKDFDVEAGVQKLLFGLRREGLAGEPKRKSWQVYGAFAIAATLVLTIGVVTLQRPPVEDAPIYRGSGAQTITTPDTARLAETLTAELEALGIKPKVTRFGTTITLNAEWPAKPDAKHVEFLKRNGVKQPQSGPLVIELTQAENSK